jgi:hypothetical protein
MLRVVEAEVPKHFGQSFGFPRQEADGQNHAALRDGEVLDEDRAISPVTFTFANPAANAVQTNYTHGGGLEIPDGEAQDRHTPACNSPGATTDGKGASGGWRLRSGIVTAAGWVLAGAKLRGKATRQPPMSREVWHCWYEQDQRATYRMPPVRRFYTRVALGFGLILNAFWLDGFGEIGQSVFAPMSEDRPGT